jgi:hypothetical protein
MTIMTENGVAYSPAKLPNLNAAVHPTVRFDHTALRTSQTTLDLSITVQIGIKEARGSNSYKILNATSKFTFVSDKLTLDELYMAWEKSFNNTYTGFAKVFLAAGMPPMKVSMTSKGNLESTISRVLSMFNDTEYVSE